MKKTLFYFFVLAVSLAILIPFSFAGTPESEFNMSEFPPPGYKGIHQLETEAHKDYVKPVSERPPEGLKPIPLAPFAPGVSRIVFGYMPYWEDTNTKIDWLRYNLITHIAWHSVEINTNGTIGNPNGWPNYYLINKAHANGTKVLLSATNFSSGSTFLANPTARYTSITSLLSLVSKATADGVTIDIESMPYSAVSRANLSSYMHDIATTFHNANPNYHVSIAVEPLSNNFDFNSLSNDLDSLFIMWYNFYYSGSGSTGPNAPLSRGGYYSSSYSQLSKINSYLQSNNFRRDKIIMGYPLYGLRWDTNSPSAHATVYPGTDTNVISNLLGSEATSTRAWDTASQTPWFYTQVNSTTWRQTWYDNPESLGYKYDLVNNLGLGGVGFWAFAYDYSSTQYWSIISTKFFGVSTVAQGIKNGSFDNTRSNWVNWEFSNSAMSISTGTTAYAGGRAAAITQTSGTGAAFYQTDGRIQVGQTWTIDAWLFQNGFGAGSCNWGWAGSYSPYSRGTGNKNIPAGGTWNRYFVTQTFSNNTVGWRDVQATLTGAGTVYIDEVQVYAGLPAPSLQIIPTVMSFTTQQGGSSPATKPLRIGNIGGTSFTWSATTNQSWLYINPVSGAVNALSERTAQVGVTLGSLTAGTYYGQVTVSAPGATNNPQVLNVTFVVTPPPASLRILPTVMSFTTQQGTSNPATKPLQIWNDGSPSFTWSATTNQTWLYINPTTETVNAFSAQTVQVGVNLGLLTAGTYNGQVTITAAGANNSPQYLNVTFVVTPTATQVNRLWWLYE
ncbi:MAG: glycosyl hydrolase family 18 protein [bacterium]|nr:glycosyl hydrolase family 18 protein [bacterium]